MSKTISRMLDKGRTKVIEEYLIFDDLQEYLDWYLYDCFENNHRKDEQLDNDYTFSRIGYGKWEPLKIDGNNYYSLYESDYEKVTEKLYKELLEYADKKYSVHIEQQKYIGNHGNCRFTGDCKTIEEAIKESKRMANDSIDFYQNEINRLQEKIDYLNNLDHSKLVKVEYIITYPKQDEAKI